MMRIFHRLKIGAVLALWVPVLFVSQSPAQSADHTFAVGEKDFLLDGQAFEIRCGEMHFARVPREYWRHRLQLCKAMGLNTVCAYLFWNYHEFKPGQYEWSGQADAAEFCRMAKEEGLWVVLRPGPYACAEWDGGGLPWWLLKNPKIQLRTQDADFMAAATAWYKEVGRVLAPQQVTRGGPILMVQVENEYGSYGKDTEYMGKLRQALVDAGFNVPLFACNPGGDLRNGSRPDIFNVVNFGRDAAGAFRRLHEMQPTGPMMCGEFYPGWFDTWGKPHHLGKTPQYLGDLEFMLKNHYSFSLYMAHGGTSFGLWPGADRPFQPDTNSYDYDAPISEAGWIGEKFKLTHDLIVKYLPAGETLPEPPAPMPVMKIPPFPLTRTVSVFDSLPAAIEDTELRNMEAYDQGQGCILYRTELPAGPKAKLTLQEVHDFAWVFVDGKPAGVMDRRSRQFSVSLPARETPVRLDILVEAMGHVNFGKEIHDRKGLQGPAKLQVADGTATSLAGKWQVYPLRLDEALLSGLKWQGSAAQGPAFWKGSFKTDTAADTFLDLSKWGKGVVWVNGHCLSRFWNIGPTQTAYLPGPWVKVGENEVIILDLVGPVEPVLSGLEKPILDQLHPEMDFAFRAKGYGMLALEGLKPVFSATFPAGSEVQEVKFPQAATGRQFCIESVNAQDGKPFAAIAELDLLDSGGNSIAHQNWKIAYADSEEQVGEDGSATNAIDGQTANFWHTEWKNAQPAHPHRLVIDLGQDVAVGGFRYTPRAGEGVTGRIKDYNIYIGAGLVKDAGK